MSDLDLRKIENPWIREPSLDELFDDLTMRTLIAGDGLSLDCVRGLAEDLGRRLLAS